MSNLPTLFSMFIAQDLSSGQDHFVAFVDMQWKAQQEQHAHRVIRCSMRLNIRNLFTLPQTNKRGPWHRTALHVLDEPKATGLSLNYC